MRHPLRSALLWFALLVPGAACLAAAVGHGQTLPDWLAVGLGAAGGTLCLFGVVYGAWALLTAFGAWRLHRGGGLLAEWHIAPPAWNAFRGFDARRSAGDPALQNDHAPRKADAPVSIRFGQRQVMIDGAYHALRRFGVPEMTAVGWLQPGGSPECLEFALFYPRGRHGAARPMALRVPVAPEARDDAIRVFRHYRDGIPQPKVGLAYRRPWLVIGWGVGVTLASLGAAGIAWLLAAPGHAGEAMMVAMLVGLLSAIGGAFFTLVILLAVQPWRR